MIREDGSQGCDMKLVVGDDPTELDCEAAAVWRITAADQIDNRVTTANMVYCHDHAISSAQAMMDDERYNSIMARRLDRVGTRV